MKLCEIEFYCVGLGDWRPTDAEYKKWSKNKNRLDLTLCRAGVRALFQIPEDAERIWMSLHDRVGVDRFRCKLVVNRPNEYCKDTEWDLEVYEDVVGVDGYDLAEVPVDFLGLHPSTKKHFAKTRVVWLECWYK